MKDDAEIIKDKTIKTLISSTTIPYNPKLLKTNEATSSIRICFTIILI